MNYSNKLIKPKQQIKYNNTIYQCIQAYTWSGATESVNPVGSIGSDIYWGSPTYLPIEPSSISGGIVNEFLVGGELYFTSDHISYTNLI